MLLDEIRSYYRSLSLNPNASLTYRRSYLKEFLHIYLLDFIYKHDNFRELIFYGGTCLRHCFGLQRLSEDLDFEFLKGDFNLSDLEADLKKYFNTELGYEDVVFKHQKFRLYIKLPILQAIGIATAGESDFLQLKIEINSTKHAEGTYATEIQPYFSGNRTFFIKRYDLPTLMASKIMALIDRSWEHHHKDLGLTSEAKGRDYYDLIWYMAKAVKPHLSFTSFDSQAELWNAVDRKIKLVNEKSIEADLINFLDNPHEARDFTRNLKASFQSLKLSNYQA